MNTFDVIILGAGAAGMMCALTAGQHGRRVLLLDHAATAGEKIRISGGGRCNFTNLNCQPANFLSANPQFCISALAGYTPQDFLALVETRGIAWHAKTQGQLFCDGPAQQIVDLLLTACAAAAVELVLDTHVASVTRGPDGFVVASNRGDYAAGRLVVATGGRSVPKLGASGFAYDLAAQFGLPVVTPRAGLVPLVFTPALRAMLAALSGVAVNAAVGAGGAEFRDALLFTHRGLSGPAILQISSYWQPGAALTIDLAPDHDVYALLRSARTAQGRQGAATVLAQVLPRRLAQRLAAAQGCEQAKLAELPDRALAALAAAVQRWAVTPDGSEGFRKAEVTVGGVATSALSSRDLQVRGVPGLYFIGEAVDVTGHLGGHNFQWAWSSGRAAGLAV